MSAYEAQPASLVPTTTGRARGLLLSAAALGLVALAEPAAAATYYVRAATATNVGADGSTNMTSLADLTVTAGSSNAYRAITSTTAPSGTSRWRLRQAASTTQTGQEYFRAYTPVYASARIIGANATAYADFYMNTTGGSLVRATATLYEYNDATGIVGAAKGTASYTGSTTSTGRQAMNNVSFGNAQFTVASGNRLLVVYSFDMAGNRPAYLWGQASSSTPSGYQAFTVTETVPPTLTIGNATTGEAATTLAPGAAEVALDAFTLATNGGSVAPTSVTVTMPAGSAALVGSLTLENTSACNQGTPYSTISNPATDAPSFTSFSGLTVGTSASSLWVCLAPKSHASMPPVPGSQVAVTGRVTDVAATGWAQAGSDTVSAARTIDNLSPASGPSGLSGAAGDAQVVLAWSGEPTDADFTAGGEVVVLRRGGSAPADVPVEGANYAGGETVGASTVACVAAPGARTCTATGLANGTDYYFVAFARDSRMNYSADSAAAGPIRPLPALTLANATTGEAASTVAPGAAKIALDAFTLRTSTGTVVPSSITVTLPAGSASLLESITLENGSACTQATPHSTVANPVSDTPSFTSFTGLSIGTVAVPLFVCIKPKTHANMPAPPGTEVAVTGLVSAVAATGYSLSGSDTVSPARTVDNLSPSAVSGVSGTGGDGRVVVAWTGAPTSPDFTAGGEVVVLAALGAAPADRPAEGTDYAGGETVGGSLVGCVAPAGTNTCTVTGLANGSDYYFVAYARDVRLNYSLGSTAVGPVTPEAAGAQLVYSVSTTTPQARGYVRSSNSFNSAVATAAGAGQTFVVDRSSSERDEHVAGYVTTGGLLYVLRWNGTSWSNEWNATVGGGGVNGRRFDIAYENASGRAMVVYSTNGAGATAELAYRIWNGTSWTAQATIQSARLTGAANSVKLTARKAAGSNAIALAVADTAADLTAFTWDGGAWGNEPTAALSTIVAQTSVAGDRDPFDLAYENQSGDLLVVWGTVSGTTYTNRYAKLSGTTWTVDQTLSATGRNVQVMFAAADPDPASNRIVIGWDRIGSATRYAVVWNRALGVINNVGVNASTSIPANSHQMTGAWLSWGASKRAVVTYQSATSTSLDYGYYDATANSWTTDLAVAGQSSSARRWVAMDVDPQHRDTLVLTYSDANNRLWAKRLAYGTPGLTWTDADGDVALTTALASTTTQNFAFWFNRLIPPTTNVGDGTEPANVAQLCPGGSALVDAFTLQTNRGTDTLTSATVSLSAGAGGRIGSVEIRNDADTAGYGSAATAGSDAPVVPLSGVTATTTAVQYKVKVTANGHGSIPAGTWVETATIAEIEHATTHLADYFDFASATVTIDRAAPAAATWSPAAPDDQKVILSWTNPAADFAEVVVLRNTSSIADAPTDGQTYAAGQTIGTSRVVYAGSLQTAADTSLTNGTSYYYAIFAKDACGNYSAGAQTGPVVPAPVDARTVYSAGAASATPTVRGYAGLTNQFVAGAPTVAGAASSTFYVDRAAPTRTEHVAGYVTTGGVLYVLRWNGTTWSAEWSATVGGDGVNGRRFDIAYENAGGDAIVVYSNNTAGASELRYRVWNGATWTAATSLDSARLTAVPAWVKMLPRPGSDEIALTVADNGTATGNNADLTTLVWSGSAWGNEPAAAHATNLSSTTGQLIQNELFDMAWETQSGVLWVFWTQSTPQQYRRSLSAARPTGTWGTAASFASGDALPGQIVAASDPASNNVVVAWNSGTAVYAAVEAGGTWSGPAAVDGTTTPQTPAIQKRTLAARWLVGGGTSYPLVVWGTSTAGTVGRTYATVSGSSVTWAAAATTAFGGTTPSAWAWMDLSVDPWGGDTAMLTFSDGAGDLWAKRLVLSAGPTSAWTNADGGAALTTTLTNATTQDFSFAYDRWVTPSIAIGDNAGTEATDQTVCFNAGATDLDFFTMSGRNTNVTGIGVTLTGPAGVVQTLAVTDDSGATLGSKTSPALADTVPIGSPPVLSRLPAQFRLRITPDPAMAVPGDLTITGTVTAVANSNGATPSGSDATSATITIDNQEPDAIGALAAIPDESQVTLTWTNPADDYAGAIVLRDTVGTSSWAPVKGATYAANLAAPPAGGSGNLRIVRVTAPGETSFVDTGLTNGTTYYYRIFSFDPCRIYGGSTPFASARPNATTTVAAGSPGAATANVCPGGPSTFANAFALRVSSGAADTVTSVTTELPEGTAQAVSRVDVVSWSGSGESASLGNATAPSGDSFTVGGLSLSATTTPSQYRIKITPKARGAFPPGAYAVTAPFSSGTHSLPDNNLVVSDVAEATITIDQQPPPAVTGLTATNPAARQVRLDWANPPSDFSGTVRIYRHTAEFSDAPAAGSDPAAGTLPSGVVVMAPAASATTYTDGAGLADATIYYYKVFVRDGCMNWSDAASVTAETADYRTYVVAPLLAEQIDCSHAYLAASYGSDFNGNNAVTFTRGTAAGGPFGTTVCSNVGGGIAPRTCTDSGLVAGTTYYYRATFTDSDGFVGGVSTADSAPVSVPDGCSNVTPGSDVASTPAPVVAIVNPGHGSRVGGSFRVQVQVFDRPGAGIAALNLSTDGGQADCAADSLNGFSQTSHAFRAPVPPATGVTRMYEKQVTLATDRTYFLRACARNASGTIQSELVRVTYKVAHSGDGNLLVRDDSAQLCSDCHNLPSHSSETTSAKYGSWSTTCSDCHQPHGTRNLGLLKQQITPPAYRGFVAPRNVIFRDFTTGDSQTSANVSYVTSDPTKLSSGTYGPCQACHTQTVDPEASPPRPARWRSSGNEDAAHFQGADTVACTVCHSHSLGFAAGEPPVPGAKCGGCHRTIFNLVKTAGQPNAHRIDLDQGGDTQLDWSAQATLSAVPSSQRSCLNTCHADHPHDLTSPFSATHEGNVYADPSTNGSRGAAALDRVGSGGAGGVNRAKSDFDPASNDGLCVKCHAKPIAANRATVTAAAYGASAHDYTSNAAGATTYAWTYPLHDGSTFARNCTKCHASAAEGTAPAFGNSSTRGLTTVHGSASASLLAGTKNPAGVAAGFVCYNCHGATAGPASGAQGNRSGKNVESQAAKASRHNVNADSVHDSETEFSGTFAVGTMHVSCLDCHDVHAATAANPLANAPGVDPANGAAGAAPASYTFTRIANQGEQYKACLRCHSNFTAILPAGTTNAAIPFNPANDSQHYVEWDKLAGNAAPVNTTGTGPGIWGGNATYGGARFNLTVIPGKTRTYAEVMMPRPAFTYTDANLRSLVLRCSDCHGDDAADGGNAVPEGPHGSTRTRLLKTPAGSTYTTWNATVAYPGNATAIWCFNCHINDFTNSGFYGESTGLHISKHDGEQCQNCHLANPHGRTESGSANQRKHLLRSDRFTDGIDAVQSGGGYSENNHDLGPSAAGCT